MIFIRYLIPKFVRVWLLSFLPSKSSDPNLDSWHVQFIEYLSLVLAPRTYVEIGIYEGETFNKVLPNIGKGYAVDIRETALNFLKDNKKIVKVLGTSSELHGMLEGASESIDLAFIDANHEKSAVIEDFKQIENFVSEDGLVILHDTFPLSRYYSSYEHCGDAFLAVSELVSLFPNWTFLTIKRHPGITLCSRKSFSPSWFSNSR